MRAVVVPQVPGTCDPCPQRSCSAGPRGGGPVARRVLPLLAGLTAVLAACGSDPARDMAGSVVEGPSYGVDRGAWPGTIEGARELLAALPDDLDGRAQDDLPMEEGAAEEYASVSYDESSTTVTVTDGTFDGLPEEDTDALDKLTALFGLGLGCDMDTYEGSIAPATEYPGPGWEDVPDGTTAWFACRVDGAEGDDGYTAEAVGWTSTTEVAWLVVGPDEDAVRALVAAMREAGT